MVLRVVAFVVACAVLAGCEEGGSGYADNHGYGDEYTSTTALDVKARCDYAENCPTDDQIDTGLRAAAMCIGVSHEVEPRDLMLIGTNDIPDGRLGMYFTDPSLILIAEDQGDFVRTERIAHEMTHYLLYRYTGSPYSNHEHACFDGFALVPHIFDAQAIAQQIP